MLADACGEPDHPADRFGVTMSRRHEPALRDWARRTLWLFAVAAVVAMASAVLAQNNPLGQAPSTPPRPFQEKGSAPVSGPPGKTTPQTVTDKLERYAKDWQSKQVRPRERDTFFTIYDPRDRAEFEALAHYSLLILTVVTQSAEELPLKRVYLRMPDRGIPLLKIGSWRREADQTLATFKMFGPYREDGFYLFPTVAQIRIAQIQVDFAANRSGLPVLELPTQDVPDWLRTMQNPDPLPGAVPNIRALQDKIRRVTSGFPIPTSLPSAPEARRPAPVPVPQSDDPTKPAALKDLFKK
jgi:hypothetical protein